MLGAQPLDAIRAGLERFEALPGRMRVIDTAGGLRVIDDSYNANPLSMEAALRALRSLHSQGAAVSVIGDMLELGANAEKLHAAVGELAARLGVDVVIGVGPLAAHTVRSAREAGVRETHAVSDCSAAAAEDAESSIGSVVMYSVNGMRRSLSNGNAFACMSA